MTNESNTSHLQHRLVSLFTRQKEEGCRILNRKQKDSHHNFHWYLSSKLNSNISIPGAEYEHYSRAKRAMQVRSIPNKRKINELSSTMLVIETSTPSVVKSKYEIRLPTLHSKNTESVAQMYQCREPGRSDYSTPLRQESPLRIRRKE